MTPFETIEPGLEAFVKLVRADPSLCAELESSAREFFCGQAPLEATGETLLCARRHLEWFILERHSPALFGVPVERLLDTWRSAVGEEIAELAPSLQDSFAGIFEVTEARPGEGAWLRDLAGFGSYALATDTAAHLQPGDLFVGRLFPVGDGLHRSSPAAALFRDAHLRQALERDLGELRGRGGSHVLHVSQAELEAMFWGSGHRPVSGDPVGEAKSFLVQAGLESDDIRRIFSRLAAAPLEDSQFLGGGGDTLAQVLSELAFETTMDLERARRHLTLAWAALVEPGKAQESKVQSETSTDPEAGVARKAVQSFTRGRASGADLDALFSNLERDLELEDGDDAQAEDAEDESPAPDFPGVIGAMIDEFLWETERGAGQAGVQRMACLRLLADFGAHIGVFEELDARELLRFTTFWVHEHGVLSGPGEARRLLDALEAFCHWAQAEHEMPLKEEFGPTVARLRESLPRVVELNRMLHAAPADETGELYEVRVNSRGSFAGLRDRAGNDHSAAPEEALARSLRDGDRLRGSISLEGLLTIFRCYPPESSGLLEG